MSLYGRVDSTANQTAVGLTIGNSGGSVTKTIVFVDETEAALQQTKAWYHSTWLVGISHIY